MERTLSRPSMPLTATQAEYRDGVAGKLDAGTYSLERVACLCGSDDDVPIAGHDRFGLPVGVVLCTACGLARTSPRLATANLGKFYEHDYHGLHFGLHAPDPDTALFRRGQGATIAAFLRHLLPPGALRVADIGAGTGQVLREFATAVDREVLGVGCEYSSAFVEAGRQAGTDMRQGGPEVLLDDAPFDVILMSHVVEHFPDPVNDLAAVRRLGRTKTIFYVEVPGLLTIDQKPEYAYTLGQYLTLAHTYHFTMHTLADAMQRAGFLMLHGDEEVRSAFIEAPPDDPPPRAGMADAIRASLQRLDSWPMRLRRLRLQLRLCARQAAAVAAKAVLPRWAVAAIRSRR